MCSFACLSRTCILISTFSDWIHNVGMMTVHVGYVKTMLVTSSSQEMRKYSMFSAIFYWDYPPLHQSSAELVRSPNTKQFSDIYFCLTFHQLWDIWEKVSKGNSLSCLVLLPKRFSEKRLIPFLHFFLSLFLSVFGLKQFQPFKQPVMIRLEVICRTKMYFKWKNISIPWTSCNNIVICTIYFPPPHWFWKSVRYIGLICVYRKLSNSKG